MGGRVGLVVPSVRPQLAVWLGLSGFGHNRKVVVQGKIAGLSGLGHNRKMTHVHVDPVLELLMET